MLLVLQTIKQSCFTLLVAGLFLSPLQAHAKPIYQWKMAETWPKDFPIFGDAAKRFVENVKVLSGGRMEVITESREIHKQPFGVFDLVQKGEYEMGHSASFYWKDKDINTAFFTSLPMGLTTIEQYGWFYHGGGQTLMQNMVYYHFLAVIRGCKWAAGLINPLIRWKTYRV